MRQVCGLERAIVQNPDGFLKGFIESSDHAVKGPAVVDVAPIKSLQAQSDGGERPRPFFLVDVDAFRDKEGLEAFDFSIRERHVLDKGGFVWVTGFPVLAPCVHLLQGVFAAKPLAQNAGERA